MRPRLPLLLSLCSVWLLSPPAALHAQGDWGLTRERAPARKRAAPRRTGRPSTAKRAPRSRDEVMRKRYLDMLLSRPLERFALDRLLTLQRKRDGNLDGLAGELAARSARAPDDYALWLLRGEVDAARQQPEAARVAYERAGALKPKAAAPRLLLARLAQQAGDDAAAEPLFGEALERTSDAKQREEILRTLADMALDREDFTLAETRYAELLKRAKGSGFQATEWARALAERGHHQRAAEAYGAVARRLRGDNRVLPPVLLEQARAELDAGRAPDALATLKRARKLAAGASGMRYAIDELRVEVHRRQGTLDVLAGSLSRERGRLFEQVELLARIYDELGKHEEAQAALRRALALRPRHTESRLRLIRILTARGELKPAIAEYRKLVAGAPKQVRYLVELAQLLMESGARGEALAVLDGAGRRAPRNGDLHRALHDVYVRWGERKRATRVLQTLARIEPGDPEHLVALGEQHLEDGNEKAALATWRRILKVGKSRARAHAVLAGTYMDHDMAERALTQWEAAVRLSPTELRYIRGLAEVLERLHRPVDAIRQWRRVLELEAQDRVVRREARRRLVRLWSLTGELQANINRLQKAFGWRQGRPVATAKPDLDAGRMLAEAYAAKGRGRGRRRGKPRFLHESERVIERVIELAPGDVDSMLALERARTTRGDPEGATEVLERLVKADPKNARAYLARMAEHALTLYRDDDAVRFAERSVALNPDDAIAQRRLGDLYRARQSTTRAMASYRRAIELDGNAFPVHMLLAELHLSRGETRDADELLQRVMRASPDDDLVRRATRALLQLHLGQESLKSLEQALLPLALAHGKRPVYRRLLVELYEMLTRPLVDRARGHTAAGAVAARAELATLGRRAIKPLLEALADEDPSQKRVAVTLLGHIDNGDAALPLLRLAESDAPTALRRDALLSAAAIAPDALAGRLAALGQARERRIQEAAAWGLCRMAGPRALPHLRELARGSAPTARGYGMLGLARAGDRASLPRLREAARRDRSTFVRGAALLALGAMGDRESLAAIGAAAHAERGATAVSAVIALGALGDRRAVPDLADLLLAASPELRAAALWSLQWLAGDRGAAAPAVVPMPSERARLAPWVAAWRAQAPPQGPERVLEVFAPAVVDAVRGGLGGDRGSVLRALQLLGGSWGEGAAPTDPQILGGLLDTLRPDLRKVLEHPDASVRARTVELLTGRGDSEALLGALADADEGVRGAALEGLSAGSERAPRVAATIAAIAREDSRWWMRRRAVEALGRLGTPGTVATLTQVVRSDPFAYVREAAVGALERVANGTHCADGRNCAATPARAAVQSALQDPEPRVRQLAAAALARLTSDVSRD